jgi:hypothetical protein
MKPDDAITILLPTSPIRLHPSTEIIDQTIASVRHWLPNAQIWIMADGVRPEQEQYAGRYLLYLSNVSDKLKARAYGNCAALSFVKHTHQVGMTRHTLHNVTTPLVLFMEHDCPLVVDRDIDWLGIINAIGFGHVNCVRFLNESRVAPHHLYLFSEQIRHCGVDLWKTYQWSQRPHVATVEMYKRAMAVFSPEANTMIEDRLMTFVEHSPWEAWKCAVYIPGDNYHRSLHLDGRGSDSKFEDEMRF